MSALSGNIKSEKIVEDIFADLVPGDEANIDCYSKHAKHYDEGLNGVSYENPKRFASMAMRHLQVNSDKSQALDICAGTGLMGEELRLQGFKGAIDAVDGNESMLYEAKGKGIFRNLVTAIITPDTRLPYGDNSYDVMLCGGAFSAGHLRPECLPEFFRILKPGGTLTFNTTNFNQYDDQVSDKDMDKADTVIESLVKSGVCRLVDSMTCECFSGLSDGFKYKNGMIDLIRCYQKI